MRYWLARGKKSKTGLYREFFQAVRRAEAEKEAEDVQLMDMHGQTNWKALAWRMEHRHPERWGKRETVTHELAQGHQKATAVLSQARVRELLDDAAAEIELASQPSSPGSKTK